MRWSREDGAITPLPLREGEGKRSHVPSRLVTMKRARIVI